MSLEPHPEASLRQRVGEAYAAKRAIALWSSERIVDGETIALDAGSTTGVLADLLRGFVHLTVVTAGLSAIETLADAPGVDVIALGGRLRSLSQAFVGPLAESSLERLSFDRAFMGADAVRADRGICEADLQQTRLKEMLMQRAEHTYVLAHAAKLGQAPFHAWAVMPPRWTLVTDRAATREQLDPFHAHGVEVVIADIAVDATA